jgi:Xaa-Pro aminopeptidase
MIAIDMEATTVKAHAGSTICAFIASSRTIRWTRLAEALKDWKLERSRVGIELEFLPAKDFSTLQKRLPSVQWIAADTIFNKARQIKTPGELALLRELSKLTDAAIGHALRSAKVGMSEMELAGTLLRALFAGGAESYKLMIIASGERSEFPNVGPSERKLRHGDIIRMEIFGQKNGYLTGRMSHRGRRRCDAGAI